MRKATLFATSCIALVAFLGLSAPGAFAADPGCNGNNLPLGIYNDALQIGKFDLSFTPTTAGAAAEINGGAILCGTDTSTGRYFQAARIIGPNKNEKFRCARPSPPTTGLCPDPAIGDGRYTGSAVSDVYCKPTIPCFIHQFDNTPTKTYVRYDTSGPGSDTNRCLASSQTIVGCFSSEANIIGINCAADIIVDKASRTAPYTLTLYPVTCDSGANPTYFDTIDNLQICQYAGAVGGTSCGSNTADWLQKNGNAGPWTYTLGARLTDGTILTATASGSWT